MKRNLRKIEDEEWRSIPFVDGNYEISNYGRVKSFFYNKVDGKILKPGKIGGFPSVTLRMNGKTKSFLIHKLTAELFVPKSSDEQNIVIHLDWNKQNNYFKNLQWVTRDESYKRMFRKFKENERKSGKIIRRNTKLKPEDVKVLKSMLSKGIKQNVIAKLFCISEMQVTRIKRNENWGAIELPKEELEKV